MERRGIDGGLRRAEHRRLEWSVEEGRAIGVVLRQKLRQGKPLTVIAFISKRIDTDDIATAEYRALIEGLRLAVPNEPTTLRVFTDSNFIPDQITTRTRSSSPAMRPLYKLAT